MNDLTNQLSHFTDWLTHARWNVLGIHCNELGQQQPGRIDISLVEHSLAAILYDLVRPALGAEWHDIHTYNPCGRRDYALPIGWHGFNALTAGEGLCAAIGVNYRTNLTVNARISSYGFRKSLVAAFLTNSPIANCVDTQCLLTEGARFFTELVELYFAVFGRGNTLNEYFLDRQEHDAVFRKHRVLIVEYANQADSAMLTISPKNDTFRITCAGELSRTLRGLGTISPFAAVFAGRDLAAEFWLTAWQAFRDSLTDQRTTCRSRTSRDWVPMALRRMSIGRNRQEPSLLTLLRLAREAAEHLLLSCNMDLASRLERVYPYPARFDRRSEENTGMTGKLGRLLKMLQGNLCLVPWAKAINGNPTPIVVLPALLPSGTVLPETTSPDGILYREKRLGITVASSWTFVLSDGTMPKASAWHPASQSAHELFGRLCIQPSSHSKAVRWPWESDSSDKAPDLPSVDITNLRTAFHPYEGNGDKLCKLIRTAQLLTGISHEARGVSFTFLYGEPVVLKGIDYSISNEKAGERVKGSCALMQSADPDDDATDEAKRLAQRCSGYYAIFQHAGVAGYVDAVHDTHCLLDRIVSLRSPSQGEVAALRADSMPEDEFLSVRAITRVYSGCCVALVAHSDGNLYVFEHGKLVVVWRKKVPADQKRWRATLELGDNSPLLKHLRKLLRDVMGNGGSDSALDDIVTTIRVISETPGEGATFVFDPRGREDQALCDMVPDDFKMEWARARRLNGLEQHVLRSLAVMDGAVHVSRHDEGHLVRARRFIMATPRPKECGDAGGPFDADCLLARLKSWHGTLECCSEAVEDMPDDARCALDATRKWKREIGAKGARHTSVFQFMVDFEQRIPFREKASDCPLVCTISADGPVNLYQLRQCPSWNDGKCGRRMNVPTPCKTEYCTYLWTERVI